MDKLQRDGKEDTPRQRRFLYPLLFQEDLYAIAYDHYFNRSSSFEPMENSSSNDRFSFLTVKRLISRIRQQNGSIVPFVNCDQTKLVGHNRSFYSELVLGGLTAVPEVPFSIRSKHSLERMNEWTSFRSIHSIFPLMEDKIPHSNFILDIRIPHLTHPEILVRTFRRWIQDAPSLHSLRSVLHEHRNLIISSNLDQLILIASKENTRLSLFLWNYYAYECESLLVPLWKRFSYSRSLPYESFIERTPFYRKIEHIVIFYHKYLKKSLWFLKDPSIHYVKHRERSIIALRGTYLLAKKWRYHITKFWQCHFHLWPQPYRIYIDELSNNCFYFLGYLLSVKMKTSVVRIKMLDDSFITDLITKEFDPIAPTTLLIGSLAKEKFCDISGHPISRLAWTGLTDDDILDRFDRIWRNIFHYHSGSSKKDGLYRMKYILRLPCAKTLACKHKSAIRVVRERFGSELFTKSSPKERESIFLSFSKTRSQRERIWHSDIIQINPLINSCRKKHNLQIEPLFDR
uniref:Maturase K n=1 Tax=Dioon rzedowskii TaxID=115876 RepID=D7NLL8_9SPER|nr:maturase K [Dioon rzedowskii]WJR82869.1 maturase K [Dioon spinulosum]